MAEDETPRRGTYAGEVYGGLLGRLVELETTRKSSIEQRGLAVISTSGGLVTLLIALSALLLGKDSNATFGSDTRALLVAAVVAFIVAASFGLAANTPRAYSGMSSDDLDRVVNEHAWSSDKEEAALLVAQQQAAEIKRSRTLNNRKARYVQIGMSGEVLGVVLVAAGIIVTLIP